MIICVFRALNNQNYGPKTSLCTKIQKLQKKHESPHRQLARPAITRCENMIASYSNPRKTREVLYFALNKNLMRFGFGVFVGCRQDWGMFYYFLVSLLRCHRPDNEPKLWFKLWLDSRL